jgi:hypothetical protein
VESLGQDLLMLLLLVVVVMSVSYPHVTLAQQGLHLLAMLHIVQPLLMRLPAAARELQAAGQHMQLDLAVQEPAEAVQGLRCSWSRQQ